MTRRVAIITKGYPRLSETFIAQEMLGLQERGMVFDIWSLRHPTDKQVHSTHEAITAPIHYLPEYVRQEPGRVLRALGRAMRQRGFWRAARVWLRDMIRARDINRVRRFAQAAVLATETPPETAFLYAHFLHTPTSVTRYAAIMRGLPWGFSAHAKDIWTIPEWEKREKINDASFGVTCTRYGAEHLAALGPPGRVALAYHGLDLSLLPPPPLRERHPDAPVTILSVGRLVEKKGFDLLLDALSELPTELDWRFIHVGGGELAKPLAAQAERLGIASRIDWRGPQKREAVFAAMDEADLFVLPSRIAASGDRDGLPNVLMEAASQGLPVVSTDFSAIPEFVEDGVSGVLVPPDDAPALSRALEGLARDPDRAARYAKRLRARLEADFEAQASIDAIATRIEAAMT